MLSIAHRPLTARLTPTALHPHHTTRPSFLAIPLCLLRQSPPLRSHLTTSSTPMAPKVLLTRPLLPAGDALLRSAVSKGAVELTERTEDSTAPRDWVLGKLREGGYEAIIGMLGDKFDEELLEAAGPSLKVISTVSAGYDHVETEALKKRGVKLGTTPDALTDATADITAMLVLMSSRRAGEGVRAVVDGKWPQMPWTPSLLCGQTLQKSTVGILGMGRIGQLTLKRLLGFGIGRALYTTSRPGQPLDPSKDYFGLLASPSIPIKAAASLDQLAAESDFLIVSCALNASTQNLINERLLSLMKPASHLINTARGPIVDSEALAAAVSSGRLAGAGLDVVAGEPNIGADHPLVKEHKIVLLPHIGSGTWETRGEMARQGVANALAGLGVEGAEWENEVRL